MDQIHGDEIQINKDTVMAMGKSRCGSIHSSAALVMVPNPARPLDGWFNIVPFGGFLSHGRFPGVTGFNTTVKCFSDLDDLGYPPWIGNLHFNILKHHREIISIKHPHAMFELPKIHGTFTNPKIAWWSSEGEDFGMSSLGPFVFCYLKISGSSGFFWILLDSSGFYNYWSIPLVSPEVWPIH